MVFARAKKREPLGEAGLFEYAVGALARRMRTERDLRRLMRLRAEEGEAGGRAMDAVVVSRKDAASGTVVRSNEVTVNVVP